MDIRAALIAIHRAFEERAVDHALIGGLALSAHGAARATVDLDWIADGFKSKAVDEALRQQGYEAVHRNDNVGNYISRDPVKGRVDVLFVRRENGVAILRRASGQSVLGETVPVVDASDLIGLKVQGYANNPLRRHRELADIERLLSFAVIDADRVRNYFRMFECESDLDDLLAGLEKA